MFIDLCHWMPDIHFSVPCYFKCVYRIYSQEQVLIKIIISKLDYVFTFSKSTDVWWQVHVYNLPFWYTKEEWFSFTL